MDTGILQAQDLVNWKLKNGALKVPATPRKVIISPQMKLIREKQGFFSKQIKGLVGTHLCLDAEKGIYLSGGWGIGASALIAVCEELRVLGATEFYLSGISGRLTNDVKEGAIAIATSAIREEGTSQHYLSADSSPLAECPDKNGMELLAASLRAQKAIFVCTDAPYRETKEKYDNWMAQNAALIDMETSALFAFGQFYGLKAYSIGVAADSIAGGKWTMAANYAHVEKQLSNVVDKLIDILKR